VDIGAAPGAWTQYLACTSERVVAIDPACLSAACLALPNVVHLKQQSQLCVDDTLRALELPGASGQALSLDLIVCDMNMPTAVTCAAIAPLLAALRPGGRVVMTCKMRGDGRKKDFAHVFSRFETLEDMQVLWLLANTPYERTFAGRKRL